MNQERRASGKRIRQARFDAGLTQAALARRAGVSERNVVRWENDQHSPRLEHVIALAEATGKDVSFFFAADEDEEDSELPTEREHEFLEALRPLARLLASTNQPAVFAGTTERGNR